MASYRYREHKAPAKRTYDLNGKVLTITGRLRLGRFRTEVDLSGVSPDSIRFTGILGSALKRATIYLMFVVVVASFFARTEILPRLAILLIAAFAAIPGLIVLFRFSRQVDIEQFKSHTGAVAFDIFREKSQAREFDDFMQMLGEAVRGAQTKAQPNQAAQRTSATPPSLT